MTPTPYTTAQRWVNEGFVLSPSLAFEGDVVGEASIIVMPNGTLRMYYAVSSGFISTATSANGRTWTKYGLTVLGNGAGGEAGTAQRVCAVLVNEIVYLFYNDLASSPTGSIKLVTSTNGVTFSSPVVVIAESAGHRWANLRVVANPTGGYLMLLESDASGVWRTGRASAASISGPWTVDVQVLSTYKLDSALGSASPGSPHYISGRWWSWPWMQPFGDPIAGVSSEIYYNSSADFNTWVFPKKVIPAVGYYTSDSVTLVGQFADACVLEFQGETLLYHSAVFTGSVSSVACDIRLWSYPGTIERMLRDVGEGYLARAA